MLSRCSHLGKFYMNVKRFQQRYFKVILQYDWDALDIVQHIVYIYFVLGCRLSVIIVQITLKPFHFLNHQLFFQCVLRNNIYVLHA